MYGRDRAFVSAHVRLPTGPIGGELERFGPTWVTLCPVSASSPPVFYRCLDEKRGITRREGHQKMHSQPIFGRRTVIRRGGHSEETRKAAKSCHWLTYPYLPRWHACFGSGHSRADGIRHRLLGVGRLSRDLLHCRWTGTLQQRGKAGERQAAQTALGPKTTTKDEKKKLFRDGMI